MQKVIYNVVYNRKNKLLKNGTSLIQIEAYLNKKKKYFSTNIYVEPDHWDYRKRIIKDNHRNSSYLNRQIRDTIREMEDIELKQRQSGKVFSLQYLADILKGEHSVYFVEFCKKELSLAQLGPGTKRQHRAAIGHIERMQPKVTFDEITFEFLVDFESHLRSRDLHQNSIFKNMAILKRYVNRAIALELYDLSRFPFRKYKIKKQKTQRGYLTPEELEKLELLKLPKDKKYLRSSLDKFLFSVYTGLRFGDMEALTPDNIVTESRNEWLVFTQQKTKEPMRIPIYLMHEDRVSKIIKRYKGKQDTIFPYKTNYTVNKHIKELCTLVGIKKTVTFHVARHTAATYLIYKGLSLTTVQKLLGHKSIATTQIYGKVMDMTMVKELQNISFSR